MEKGANPMSKLEDGIWDKIKNFLLTITHNGNGENPNASKTWDGTDDRITDLTQAILAMIVAECEGMKKQPKEILDADNWMTIYYKEYNQALTDLRQRLTRKE